MKSKKKLDDKLKFIWLIVLRNRLIILVKYIFGSIYTIFTNQFHNTRSLDFALFLLKTFTKFTKIVTNDTNRLEQQQQQGPEALEAIGEEPKVPQAVGECEGGQPPSKFVTSLLDALRSLASSLSRGSDWRSEKEKTRLVWCIFWPAFGCCKLQTLVEICIFNFQHFLSKKLKKE